MKYVCDVCGYVYDEALAILIMASPPAPSGRTCPTILYAPCGGVGKDQFSAE